MHGEHTPQACVQSGKLEPIGYTSLSNSSLTPPYHTQFTIIIIIIIIIKLYFFNNCFLHLLYLLHFSFYPINSLCNFDHLYLKLRLTKIIKVDIINVLT